MILQRDFVIMRFILRGDTSAKIRITAMKITCVNEETREKSMPKADGDIHLKNMFQSITSVRISTQRTPLYN